MKKFINLLCYIYSLLVIVLLLVSTSCSEDILKEKPLDFLAPENAYNTLPGIKQGITGLHYTVRWDWFWGDQEPGAIMRGIGTDISYMGETPGGIWMLSNYQNEMTSQNPTFTYFWTTSYEIIQRANVLISAINASDATIWANDAQRNLYLAEAKFFRAFAYRILVSLYGDVPLVTEVIRSAKTDFVRAPKTGVYKLMEEDLAYASTNLPVAGKEEAPGRITQGAAWHFLSELYLTEGKYQSAVDAASKVINGYNYHLMTKRFGTLLGKDVLGSGDVYFDLFGFGNQNLTENTESIWVIQIEPLITGGEGRYSIEKYFGPAYFRMGNTPDGFPAFRGDLVAGVYTGYSDTLGRTTATNRPTNYVVYDIWRSDWKNDIRNAENNIKRNFYYDNPKSIYNKKKIDFSKYAPGIRNAFNDTNQYIYPNFMKFIDPLHHFTQPARAGSGSNHKDQYAIRLAETILLRAEAYVGLGENNLAADDINIIRKRANAAPVLPANVNLDYILDERVRELYGEEWRPITLRRMGKLLERVRKYNNNPVFPACNIQDRNVLFPIPQSQIDLNINAKIEQNPGYTTQ